MRKKPAKTSNLYDNCANIEQVRLLNNAWHAHDLCQQGGSIWGMQYWQNVISSLNRKYLVEDKLC